MKRSLFTDALAFAKNVSDYFIVNRNRYERARRGLPQNVVFYRPGYWIYTPDNLIVWCLWDNHCTASYIRHEINEFLLAARGCSRFLDVGASAGFFSAIFLDTVGAGAAIHSIEPDAGSFRLLGETRRLNGCKTSNKVWVLSDVAFGAIPGTAEFISTGFGGSLGGTILTGRSIFAGSDPATDPTARSMVEIETLEGYCGRHCFQPDLIKVDIESYEYEVVLQSRAFLAIHRPRLHLELHNGLLRARQKEPREVLEQLFAIGYAPPDGQKGQTRALDHVQRHDISHFPLSVIA